MGTREETTVMKKKVLCVSVLGVVLLAMPAFASDVLVIANPSVSVDLTAADLKDVFLGAKSAVQGTPVLPVLATGGAAHDVFLREYVGKSDQVLRNHFKSLVFTGKGAMPKSFASDAEVVKYVASTKGAIGYVSATTDAAGVKKLQIK
jgi:hypothetical protein